MRGNKQQRNIKQQLCLLLAVILVCGAVPLESVLAVESETMLEMEAQTEEMQTGELQEPETEPAESTEPEESEPDEEPEESGEPEESDTPYENSISGVLWIDADEDGTYDGDEQPLADYPVYLYAEGDQDNAVDTATTDADGEYEFINISPGRYVVGIKAEENGTDYLLPMVGVQNDNKFYFAPDWSKVISNAVDIDTDTVVTDIDAAMRTMPGIQPMAATIIDMTTVSAGGTGYTYASNVVTITTNGEYEITGTTTTKRVVIATGVTADITLNGVNIILNNLVPLELVGTASVNLTLEDGTTNVLKNTQTTSLIGMKAGIGVPPNANLTIGGTGTLEVKGGGGSAGIGGGCVVNGVSPNNAAGTIIINSGTITARGGGNGAGIGGGFYGGSGTITINGGTVTANGGSLETGVANGLPSAGIGAGANATTSGTIRITGGQITARSNAATAPGIGSYSKTLSIGTVIFTGGSIYPTDYTGIVSVYPAPTNGSTYGAPDPVGMLTFPGYSSGDAFSMVAGGTVSSYLYKANAHPDGNVYPWLAYPGASTEAATNVTANSATLNGTYYMNGTTISSAYFEWGTSTSYGSTKTLTTPTNTTSGVIESVSDNLTGLSSNTTYHYRLVITVGSITVPGNDMTFITKPVVDTLTAAPTGSSTATISGTIASGSENISDMIITYATDAGFTANVVTINGSSGVMFTDTTYTANITGLTSGQTYYVKVEAVGPGGTSDAKTGSFLAGGYPVTEKFVNLSGSAVDSTGLPDNTVIVTGSYTASGIPTSHTVSGDIYTYIGYKLDSYTAGDTLTSGTPSSVTVTGNRDVYYIYSNIVNLTISNTITGTHANMTKAFTFTVYFEDSAGTPLSSGTQFTYTGGVIAGSGATAPFGGTLTLGSGGEATVTLTTGQTITIAGVATSAKVRVVQTTDTNYTTSFKDSLDASSTSGADTGMRNMTAADRTFDYTNTRSVVPGGIFTGSGGIVLLSLMALALAAGLAITAAYRRRAGAR